MLTRLAALASPGIAHSRDAFPRPHQSKCSLRGLLPPLLAYACDLLKSSAQVCPLDVIPENIGHILSDPSLLFPDPPEGLQDFVGINKANRVQYARLVGRHLRSGKIGLRRRVKAGGTIFCVGKSTGRLRAVLHGTRLSLAALRPLAPPFIASPTSFLDSEASKSRPMKISKRDASC